MPAATGALSGIVVLDFSQVIFGPAATAILADHGAEVIKIERPGQGDLARAFGPFLHGESMAYASLNRNKRGLALNLKSPEGREIVRALVLRADVVVSNFRAGVMESLGLGYEDLRTLNPRIIYAVGSGYGQSGPYADRNKGGHESLAQALGGLIRASVGPTVEPTRRLGITVADINAGHVLVEGILLALLARERTGRGQKVEAALLDGAIWLQAWGATGTANVPGRGEGQEAPNPLDGGVYRTQDGYIVVTGLFRANPLRDICVALGIEDLSLDPRFAGVDQMAANATALREPLQRRLLERTTGEWVEVLETADILCAPVLTPAEAIEDPQVIHNEMMVSVPHPTLGSLRLIGVPSKLSDTPGTVRTAPPRVGEHSREILRELGYDDQRIEALGARGVVAWPGD